MRGRRSGWSSFTAGPGRRLDTVGDDRLVGRHILLAAGAKPAPLPFAGAARLTTSEEFLNLDRLPRRLVFVGGGYISFEFAHVAGRAGAEVTIVHRGARPLEAFDPDMVDLLVKRTRELGIRVALDTEVGAIDAAGDGVVVRGLQNGSERRFEADLAVHGAGRVPDIDDLELDVAGVKRDKRGVIVNQFLQSLSNPAVYAGGDAAANGPQLTPKGPAISHEPAGHVRLVQHPPRPRDGLRLQGAGRGGDGPRPRRPSPPTCGSDIRFMR